jgi:hypothetical protein
MLLVLGLAPVPAKAPDQDQDLRYNPATVIDVTGVVEDIREVAAPATLRGIHFIVRAENDTVLDAYLGPAWFVREFVSNFARRSQVQVIGSKVRYGNAVVVLAREVHRGDITLYLRDKDGKPYWSETTLAPFLSGDWEFQKLWCDSGYTTHGRAVLYTATRSGSQSFSAGAM